MSFRLAAHWLLTAITAACLVTVATIPFTGQTAAAVAILAAAAVAFVGLATTPRRRT